MRGSFFVEPRMFGSPRVLRMLDHSAANLKKGMASPPIDLTPFGQD